MHNTIRLLYKKQPLTFLFVIIFIALKDTHTLTLVLMHTDFPRTEPVWGAQIILLDTQLLWL